MKKVFVLALIALLPFSLVAQAKKDSAADKSKTSENKSKTSGTATVQKSTVSAIKENVGAFSNVIVEGQITHRLSDQEFIFTDSTGSMKIDLTGETEFDLNSETLLGATVRALGVVKKRLWGDTVLEVIKLKITTPSEIGGL